MTSQRLCALVYGGSSYQGQTVLDLLRLSPDPAPLSRFLDILTVAITHVDVRHPSGHDRIASTILYEVCIVISSV
jgi:transglutaminase-like putative cysteine protease